jgi:hypothetical protein
MHDRAKDSSGELGNRNALKHGLLTMIIEAGNSVWEV